MDVTHHRPDKHVCVDQPFCLSLSTFESNRPCCSTCGPMSRPALPVYSFNFRPKNIPQSEEYVNEYFYATLRFYDASFVDTVHKMNA